MSNPERSFLSHEQASARYNLQHRPEVSRQSEVDRQLAEYGIACIEMPLRPDEFMALSRGYDICLRECPEVLARTALQVDQRFGGDAGHVRKDAKFDRRTGQQVSDPKNYMHFNEQAYPVWSDQFRRGPQILRDFIADGYEIHNTLITVARQQIQELEPTHPSISRLYFPGGRSHTYLRLLRYDAYQADSPLASAEVAKPHYDISGATIQAYADAPGFWAAKDGVHGQRVRYDSTPDSAQFFMGKGHEKIYGPEDSLRPLWHGVDRIIPAGATLIPERTAVILFVNAPEVDYHTKPTDTVPYQMSGETLAAVG